MIVNKNITELSRCLKEQLKGDVQIYEENAQLVDLVDDLLIIWSRKDASLYSQILNINEGDNLNSYKPQVLNLSRPPIWDVKNIKINKSGSGVLLIGDRGLAVVELPKRWGNPSLFQGGSDILICRIEYIFEKFLTGNPKLCVRSAMWHPGSLDHSHLILLTSDDYLRIYNLSDLDFPEQALALSKSSRHLDGSKLLGETSIAFDFGSPIYPDKGNDGDSETRKQSHIEDTIDEVEHRRKRHMELLWPLFILYSNGDVFYTITSISRKRIGRTTLYGPMTMYPKANDNYGLEFVSIVVLQSSPNVLVIGNSDGFIHHCIAMEASESDMRQREMLRGDNDLSDSISQLTLEAPSLMLHVYESVRISLSFNPEQSCAENSFSLIADTNTPARYWVIHNEGVHAVSVPVVDRLMQLAKSPQDGAALEELDFPCTVTHIVCTRPSPSLPLLAVIGLGLTSAHVGILSNSALVLLANGDITIVLNSVIPQLEGQLSDYENNNCDKKSFSQNVHNSFESHIRSILIRDISQPLLLSGAKPQLDPQEYLNLHRRVTVNLKENYIRPQTRCREEIQRRSSLLKDQKQRLERELKGVALEVKALSGKAHKLAEDYEESKEKHESIVKRIERVQSRMACQLPMLSSAEQAMFGTLQDINQSKIILKAQVGQLQDKLKWQTLQMDNQSSVDIPTLSGNQLEHLKLTITKENDSLCSLKKKIMSAKGELNLK